MTCQAKPFNDECEGDINEIDVLYTLRDMDNNYNDIWKRGQIVKVCACDYHLEWLEKIQEKRPFEMRGASVKLALEEDLFQHFTMPENIYSLVKFAYINENAENEHYVLINGSDTGTYEMSMTLMQQNPYICDLYFVGTFQYVYRIVDYGDLENEQAIESVVEWNTFTQKEANHALAEKIKFFYKPIPPPPHEKWSKIKSIRTIAEQFNMSTKKYNTKYTKESVPNFITTFYKEKDQKLKQKKMDSV